jgi:hypothetical protein
MDYKQKYLKYKQKYLELQKILQEGYGKKQKPAITESNKQEYITKYTTEPYNFTNNTDTLIEIMIEKKYSTDQIKQFDGIVLEYKNKIDDYNAIAIATDLIKNKFNEKKINKFNTLLFKYINEPYNIENKYVPDFVYLIIDNKFNEKKIKQFDTLLIKYKSILTPLNFDVIFNILYDIMITFKFNEKNIDKVNELFEKYLINENYSENYTLVLNIFKLVSNKLNDKQIVRYYTLANIYNKETSNFDDLIDLILENKTDKQIEKEYKKIKQTK